jgi:hypothetical protein
MARDYAGMSGAGPAELRWADLDFGRPVQMPIALLAVSIILCLK